MGFHSFLGRLLVLPSFAESSGTSHMSTIRYTDCGTQSVHLQSKMFGLLAQQLFFWWANKWECKSKGKAETYASNNVPCICNLPYSWEGTPSSSNPPAAILGTHGEMVWCFWKLQRNQSLYKDSLTKHNEVSFIHTGFQGKKNA